jgi:hypothetical protein
VGRHNITVGQYLTEWVEVTPPAKVALGKLTQTTADSYSERTRRHLIPDLGHIRLTVLSPRHIRTWMTAKRKEPSRRGTPHSARGVQYLHAILRRALGDALRDGDYGLVRNVATLVEVGRPESREGQPLTSVEARRVLAVISKDPLGPMWLTLMVLGLRKAQAPRPALGRYRLRHRPSHHPAVQATGRPGAGQAAHRAAAAHVGLGLEAAPAGPTPSPNGSQAVA